MDKALDRPKRCWGNKVGFLFSQQPALGEVGEIKVVTLWYPRGKKSSLFYSLVPLFKIAMVDDDLQTKKRLGPYLCCMVCMGPLAV